MLRFCVFVLLFCVFDCLVGERCSDVIYLE